MSFPQNLPRPRPTRLPSGDDEAESRSRTIPTGDMQRVLFFGKSMSRSRCSGGLVDALDRNGMTVRWLKLARIRRWVGRSGAEWCARRAFWRFRPDLLFVLSRDLPLGLLEEFRAHVPIVVWVEDLQERLDRQQTDYLRRADLVSMSDPSRFAELRQLGVRDLIYQMSGFSPRYHYPAAPRRPRRDVVFVGGPGRRHQRAEFLAALADQVDIDVFGAGWDDLRDMHPRLRVHAPIGNRRFRRVCAESRIVLGMNESNSTPGYFSNRTWLTLGCKGFHLTHYVPGLEHVFDRGVHLDWFHDVDEALERVRHYLAAPDEREAIAAEGHRFALAHHQYRHRVAAILERLSGDSVAEDDVVDAHLHTGTVDHDRLAL